MLRRVFSMVRLVTPFTLSLLFGAAAALAAAGPFQATQRDRGTVVELSVKSAANPSAPLREGDPAKFQLTLRDETTGSVLSGVYPKVWMFPRYPVDIEESKRCSAAVAALISGGLRNPASLDLNVYYVVAMNTDGSITVVDPRFSFGGTQLLGMVELDGAGFDWALASNGDRLFVSVPKSGRVAVVDTIRWKLLPDFDAGPNPRRVLASPDGQQIWVATDRGVTAIRASDSTVTATIATGAGEQDLAISEDGRFLVVTSRETKSAAVVDARKNTVLGKVDAGDAISVAFSRLSGMAYVAASDGRITVIDPKRSKAIATTSARPGITQIRIEPSGRFGFLPNPGADSVQILDTASNRIIQDAAITEAPFDVSFTSTLAYVRRLESEHVDMIPLAGIGKEGAAVPVVDFPAGEYPFGKAPRLTVASGIVPAPDENAVIIANPADSHIYYYKEGMAAPIGHFSNYKRHAQAVLVLDRSIKPSKGSYATTGILPAAGDYDVAVFIDAPRTVSCFGVKVTENPALAAKKRGMPVNIEPLASQRLIPAAASTRLAFRLRDPATQEPRAGIPDAMVLIIQAGGSWFTRQPLKPGEDGRYETDFTPPSAGVYYVYVGAPSIGLKTSNPQFLTLEAY